MGIDKNINAGENRVSWRVNMTPSAARQYASLPKPIQHRVLAILERLERWPGISGAKPLRGKLAGSYRVRTGDYRVQFRIRGDRVVVVERVGHRDGFYED